MKQLGLPYMGSKRRLAEPILDYILEQNPGTKYIYDVFGGGGAISLEASQRKNIQKVYYNDFNKCITELLKHLRDKGITDDIYNWITKEEFNILKKEDTYLGGLASTCWSFGNNQKDYLYGKKKVKTKELLHNIIVNKCEKSLEDFNQEFNLNINIKDNIFNEEYIRKRRSNVIRKIRQESNGKEKYETQHLSSINQILNIVESNILHKLDITNLSYEEVKIITPKEETIIYLDPPYENTRTYQKDISHNDLYKWIDELTKEGYKVYLSSYESPLYEVKSYSHRVTVGQTVNNFVKEKLFTNTKDEILNEINEDEW